VQVRLAIQYPENRPLGGASYRKVVTVNDCLRAVPRGCAFVLMHGGPTGAVSRERAYESWPVGDGFRLAVHKREWTSGSRVRGRTDSVYGCAAEAKACQDREQPTRMVCDM